MQELIGNSEGAMRDPVPAFILLCGFYSGGMEDQTFTKLPLDNGLVGHLVFGPGHNLGDAGDASQPCNLDPLDTEQSILFWGLGPSSGCY